jgi:YVTN family beta-propeller protein
MLGQICVGNWPQYVLFDPVNGMVYASAEYSQNVSAVDAGTLQKVASVNSSNARGLAIDPADGRLFVSNGFGDSLTVIDTANNAVLTTVNLTGYGFMVSEQYDPTTGQLLVLANNNPDILAVDPSSYAISNVIPLDPNPGGTELAIIPSTHVIYFPARGMNSVALVGELNGTTFAHISMPGIYGPTSTFYDPVNGYVYVMLGGMLDDPGNQMVVLNPATGGIVTTLTLGEWPDAYAYNPTTQLLYVSCAAAGSISVINVATNQLVGSIDLGAGTLPGGIAVDPSTGHLFVGEDGTGELVELS